jgi:hypothetical protein
MLQFVSADHLMQLAKVGSEEAHKKADVIAQRAESPLTICFLLNGRATLEEDQNLVFERTALNLCSGLAGIPYAYSCICLENCLVRAIATADLMDLLTGEPELCQALLKYFALKRLKNSDQAFNGMRCSEDGR